MKNYLIKTVCVICALFAVSCSNKITEGKEQRKTTQQLFKENIPGPRAYVNDFEKIFTEQEEVALNSFIVTVEKETTMEIVVISLDSSMVSDKEFDKLIYYIANEWGVGKKETNNGITIGISKSLRRVRVALGDGIQLSNVETKNIIDSVFTPEYKSNHYFTGTIGGINRIVKALKNK